MPNLVLYRLFIDLLYPLILSHFRFIHMQPFQIWRIIYFNSVYIIWLLTLYEAFARNCVFSTFVLIEHIDTLLLPLSLSVSNFLGW